MNKLQLTSLALLLAAGSASATVLVTESFDYGTLNNTTKFLRDSNNHNGGTGWDTNEWKSVTEPTGGIRLDTSETSINYPSQTTLSSVGGRINNSAGSGESFREFETALPGETYFSALIHWTTGSDFSIKMGDGTNIRWTPFSVNNVGELRTGANDVISGTAPLGTNTVQLVAGTSYLVVAKRASAGSNRTVYTKVYDVSNPGDFLTEPTDWDLTNSFGSGTSMSQLHADCDAASGVMDEIRIGTTYEDVVGAFDNPAFAYDNFDYEAGVAVTNGNGGIGWDGAWKHTAGGTSPLLMNTDTNSLWFGNSDPFSYDGTGHIKGTKQRTARRNMTSAYDLASGDLYFAVLIRPFSTATNNLVKARFEMYDGVDGTGNMRFNVGFADNDDADLLPNLYVQAATASYPASDSPLYASNSIPETTHLLICKRHGGSGGYIAASIYEGGTTNSLTEPGDDEWQVKDAGQTTVDLKSLYVAVSSGFVRIDELAMSDSFAGAIYNIPDVVVLPPIDGGLPSEWVLEHFGSVYAYDQSGGADGDPDDDGLTTEGEYLADTAPTNSMSLLAGIGGEVTSSNTTFFYQNGGTNADVYVDFRTDLVTGGWTPVTTNFGPVSTTNSFIHGVSGDQGFYRLRAERND